MHLVVACFLQLNKVTPGQGFAIEFFATLQLVLCVIAVTDKRRNDLQGSAPLAIGLSVGLGHLAAVSHFLFSYLCTQRKNVKINRNFYIIVASVIHRKTFERLKKS